MSTASDCRFQKRVTATLWVGLAASLGAIIAGFAWLGASGGHPREIIPLGRLAGAVFAGDPVALVSIGIVLLLATPAATVIVACVHFLRSREPAWAGIALAVIALLALSVLVSLR